MVELTRGPIRPECVLAAVQDPRAGASVLFMGTTRELTDGRQTLWLDYEGYEPLATQEMERLRRVALERWQLTGCCLVHRLGNVPIGEASVAIAVSAPHRADAFAAGQWLIDRLKQDVPIWKQEHWADGHAEWIHPPSSGPSPAPESHG